MPEVEAWQQMTQHTLSMTPMAQRCAKRGHFKKNKKKKGRGDGGEMKNFKRKSLLPAD